MTGGAVRAGGVAACVAKLVMWVILGVGAGIAAAVVAVPLALGMHPFTVLSGSMQPAVATGDVVVAETIAPREARVGDVLVFPDPSGKGRMITHRVRSIRVTGATADVVTRGDANRAGERWRVAAAGEIGRVVYRLPQLGRLAAVADTRGRRLALIVLPALVLGLMEIRRVWAGHAA